MKRIKQLWIAIEGMYYHYITCKQVPDYYWTNHFFVIRTSPVTSVKVIYEKN